MGPKDWLDGLALDDALDGELELISGVSLAYLWTRFCNYLQRFWRISGVSLEYFWSIPGIFLE